jgi:hypothetical protein
MIRLFLDGELVGEFKDSAAMGKYINDNSIDVNGKAIRFEDGD